MKQGHEELNELRDSAGKAIAGMPAAPVSRSPLDQELSDLRRTSGGGGKQRALLLEQLRTEMEIAVGYLTLIAGGVADCLEVASGRDNQVNGPALSFAVRPVLELAGQIDWLLDDDIDGSARTRRYIVWRFADLRARRMVAWDYADDDEVAALTADLDEEERILLEEVALAGWSAEPTVTSSKGITAAALLDESGKRERMPGYGELVHRVTPSQSVYSILSISAHTQRYGMIATIEADGPPTRNGKQKTRFAGFGIDTNLAIGLTVVALDRAVRLLLGWNGAQANELRERTRWILQRAGMGSSTAEQ